MTIKVLILKQDPNQYLIGHLTELDEEPSLLIQNCYRILDGAEFGETEEYVVNSANLQKPIHLKESLVEESNDSKTWWAYEYVYLESYPKYADQRDIFLTADSIFSIMDPTEEIEKLYNRYLAT